MLKLHDILRQRLLERCGIFDMSEKSKLDFATLQKTEWSPRFEQLMRNRLIMGAMRYETFEKKRRKINTYNYGYEAQRRLDTYNKTGNKEFLVDVANMCLLEFEFPYKKGAFFDNEMQHNIHAQVR